MAIDSPVEDIALNARKFISNHSINIHNMNNSAISAFVKAIRLFSVGILIRGMRFSFHSWITVRLRISTRVTEMFNHQSINRQIWSKHNEFPWTTYYNVRYPLVLYNYQLSTISYKTNMPYNNKLSGVSLSKHSRLQSAWKKSVNKTWPIHSINKSMIANLYSPHTNPINIHRRHALYIFFHIYMLLLMLQV